jgi:ribosomal protein S20
MKKSTLEISLENIDELKELIKKAQKSIDKINNFTPVLRLKDLEAVNE